MYIKRVVYIKNIKNVKIMYRYNYFISYHECVQNGIRGKKREKKKRMMGGVNREEGKRRKKKRVKGGKESLRPAQIVGGKASIYFK